MRLVAAHGLCQELPSCWGFYLRHPSFWGHHGPRVFFWMRVSREDISWRFPLKWKEIWFNLDVPSYIFWNIHPPLSCPILFLVLSSLMPVLSAVWHLICIFLLNFLQFATQASVYMLNHWFVEHLLLEYRNISHLKARKITSEVFSSWF